MDPLFHFLFLHIYMPFPFVCPEPFCNKVHSKPRCVSSAAICFSFFFFLVALLSSLPLSHYLDLHIHTSHEDPTYTIVVHDLYMSPCPASSILTLTPIITRSPLSVYRLSLLSYFVHSQFVQQHLVSHMHLFPSLAPLLCIYSRVLSVAVWGRSCSL